MSRIPAPVVSAAAAIMVMRETHDTLDSLFLYADAPGSPPEGSKQAKAVAWMRRVNAYPECNPLKIFGRLIEAYMEEDVAGNPWSDEFVKARDRLAQALARSGLQYVPGGTVVDAVGMPSRTLASFIKSQDLEAIEAEFNRALEHVGKDPREAVSAASNILESLCKAYIEDEALAMPAKRDLQSVWSVTRKHLGIDPSRVEDQDLQSILAGLIATVQGIGALRTHASSAHGASRKSYRLEPRHARLAVHAAHTVTLFVLETWSKRRRS